MFEYYFQILKNLKQDLILGFNFQRTFKISQDITDDNDLYLHIRRKIVTFNQQAKNTTNHISTHKCMQIKPQSFKQFQVKALKGLKNRAVYAWSHKSCATVDYTLIGVEPHSPTRGVWPIAAVANDSQSHLVASSIYDYAQHSSDT